MPTIKPAILLIIICLVSCTPGQAQPPDTTVAPGTAALSKPATSTLKVITLPAPRLKGVLTLEEALFQRRSVREFSDIPLTEMELGQLLWAAQGITNPSGYRTAPSAGALYPLEVYLATHEGIYHYVPRGHQLVLLHQGDIKPALYAAALRQNPVLEAPAVIVIAAVYGRTAQKYGEERSPRYVNLEAGHAAQNILLQAVALNLGAVPIGAFADEEVQKALSLPSDQQPLYLIPVGHPR